MARPSARGIDEAYLVAGLKLAHVNIFTYDVAADRFVLQIPHSDTMGYQTGELPKNLGEWKTIIHPEDWEEVQRQMREFLAGKIPKLNYQHRVADKNGQWKWIDVQGEAIERGPEGLPLRVIGFAHIIHPRKVLEERLTESEYIFRTVADNAHEAIFITEPDGRISFANQAVSRLIGYATEELIGKPILELVAPAYRELVAGNIKNRFAGQYAPPKYRYRLQRKDGALRLVEAHATRIELPGGKLKIIAQLLDLSDLMEARDNALKYQSDYKTIFDSSHEAIFIHDAQNGSLLDVNQRAMDMFGLSKEEIKERNLGELSWAEDPRFSPEKAAEKIRLATEGREQDFEWLIKAKSGQPIWVRVHLRKAELSGVDRVLAFFSDISRRKQSELEKAKLESQLRQSQKMEAIGTLAGGIAHDFNNILFAMLGYAELAEIKASQGLPVQKQLGEVKQAGVRARELVRQILAFSRRSGDEKLSMDMLPVINEAAKLIRSTLPSTIEIRFDLALREAVVKANPINIHQVIVNLCTNAAHAMAKGGLMTIQLHEVELSCQDAVLYPGLCQGKYAQLVVEDTGHGMPPEVLERIFDPFYTTKGPGQGTGMGLSVVHGIVKESGGNISVYSEPGKGTIFKVLIPLLSEKPQTEIFGQEELLRGHGSILLVDDEKQVAESGRDMLAVLGFQVQAFTNSTEAWADFSRDPSRYDLLITDLTMPQMTGLELAGRVRSLRPELPIILWTGLDTALDRAALDKLGVTELLQKPPLIRELSKTVRKALKQD